jgi:DNA polymerase-3 subunit epsilon
LKLERPLTVVDLETTGLNPEKDRVCQIGVTIFYPEEHREPVAWHSLINPGCPIPPGMNHGITDEMVADQPTFAMLAPELHRTALHDGVDIAGYNVNFDIGFLRFEFAHSGIKWEWANHVVDAFPLFKAFNRYTLENAYKRYVDREGFTGAHDAGSDVLASWKTLVGQLNEHPELPRTVPELSKFCFEKKKEPNWVDSDGKFVWINDEACFNFGKWRGQPLKKQPGYVGWMLNNTQQSPEVVEIMQNALKGIYPTR